MGVPDRAEPQLHGCRARAASDSHCATLGQATRCRPRAAHDAESLRHAVGHLLCTVSGWSYPATLSVRTAAPRPIHTGRLSNMAMPAPRSGRSSPSTKRLMPKRREIFPIRHRAMALNCRGWRGRAISIASLPLQPQPSRNEELGRGRAPSVESWPVIGFAQDE